MDWKHIVKSGFSLVELLVYVTVFAVASIGISSMFLTIQKHNIEVSQIGEYAEAKDFAQNLLKIGLKNAHSVSISDVKTNDSACLQLNQINFSQRVGIKFNGAGRTIESVLPINITGAQARSISFWVKAESGQANENVILRWGETNARQFAVVLRNGYLYVQLEGALLGSNNGISFLDNAWHHVAITFPNSTTGTRVNGNLLKQYIDGVRRDGNKNETSTSSWPPGNRYMRTTASKLLVGARDKNGTNSFKGAISNIRIWDDLLQPNDVTRIYNAAPGHDLIMSSARVLHWPMLDLNSPGQTNTLDISGQNNLGRLNNFDIGTLMSFSNRKQEVFEKFCFFDTDSDNLYELWQGAGNTPQNPTGNSAWQSKTEDIFVPGDDGFFNNVGTSPETVIANFVVGKVAGSSYTVTQKNVTSSFSSNIVQQSQALCAITPSDVFVAHGCNVNQAHAAIVEGFDPDNDQLTLRAQTKRIDRFFTYYSDIENLPPTVTAEWNGMTGVMRFYTTDNRAQPPQIWNRAMRSLRLTSTGTEYSQSKKIVFSLAEPAFEIKGRFHFYDFVDADTQPYSFDRAQSRVQQQTEPKMCGLQPYLMTITSAEENDFISNTYGVVDWPSGWIGARETEPGNWRWINGPENGTRFWSGNGAGIPITDNGTADGVATNLLTHRIPEDHLLHTDKNEKAAIWIKNSNTLNMRYTNFSLGQTGSDVREFQPKNSVSHSTNPAKYLSINGSLRGGNLWRSLPLDTAYCNVHTPSMLVHEQICGHFREWGGMPSDPPVKSASSIIIDMEKHNEYCKATP